MKQELIDRLAEEIKNFRKVFKDIVKNKLQEFETNVFDCLNKRYIEMGKLIEEYEFEQGYHKMTPRELLIHAIESMPDEKCESLLKYLQSQPEKPKQSAKEMANKILFCLYRAVKKGEPIEVEKRIIENGLHEYAQQVELPSDEERIICSAIWIKDGDIYEHQPKNIDSGIVICGRRHHNCIAIMDKLNIPFKKTKKIQGFLTSHDRFVDRKEAAKIAKIGDYLFSEDLY